MVAKLLLELVLLLPCLLIIRHHSQLAHVIYLVRTVRHHLDQIMEIVSKRLAVLDHDAPVLSICEVVLA